MGAIANGMALHGGAIPVVGTFLVFADYMRAAVRLAALSEAKVLFVWSHDSSVSVRTDRPISRSSRSPRSAPFLGCG